MNSKPMGMVGTSRFVQVVYGWFVCKELCLTHHTECIFIASMHQTNPLYKEAL